MKLSNTTFKELLKKLELEDYDLGTYGFIGKYKGIELDCYIDTEKDNECVIVQEYFLGTVSNYSQLEMTPVQKEMLNKRVEELLEIIYKEEAEEEEQRKEIEKDIEEYQKDPYRYNGVKRSDFFS